MRFSGISFRTTLPSFISNNPIYTSNFQNIDLINTIYFFDTPAYDFSQDLYKISGLNAGLLFGYDQPLNAALVYGPLLKFQKTPYTPENMSIKKKMPYGLATMLVGTRDNEIVKNEHLTLADFSAISGNLANMFSLENEHAVKTLVISQFVDSTLAYEIIQNQKNKILNDQGINFHLEYYMMTRIFATNGMVSITDLVEEIGYSRRHVYQVFKNSVGLSIKFFCRLVRFQIALAWMLNNIGKRIEIAHEFGFYDQAHFIHEFYEMTKNTPQHLQQLYQDGIDLGLNQTPS